jgi:hypothetical protein
MREKNIPLMFFHFVERERERDAGTFAQIIKREREREKLDKGRYFLWKVDV